jgi:type IV secretion system protein VirD4
MTDVSLGQILANPEPFVQATRLWIGSNATLLAGCAVGALTAAGVAGFGVGAVVDRVRQSAEDRRRYGGAREARHAGLLRNPKLEYSGIPMGRIGRKRLCWVDQEPVLVTGGTRSGKGAGVIRPACLTYGGPMVMYDGGKGELFRDTSGWRSRFSPHHCSRNRLEKVFISSCARKKDIEFRRCSWRSAVGVVGTRTVMPGGEQ